ncbi:MULTISPECIES: site-specific integrase [Streptomyces]|uniref:site-specific integrase n=1 Tax=Streptomyces TaxID=1883 RepID=UPI0023F81BF5|nr:site-specific integrase [Streptomyces sp. JH010]MDF6066172.1 site-specific integrase [Streptomyces sp. JH010]
MTSTATHVGSSFVPRVTSMVGAEELKLMSRFPHRERPSTWEATAVTREEVLERLARPPLRAVEPSAQANRMFGARLLLDWLMTFPGETWQQRWQESPAHGQHIASQGWRDAFAAWARPEGRVSRRETLLVGVLALLCADAVRPDPEFLIGSRSRHLRPALETTRDPEGFARLRASLPTNISAANISSGLKTIAEIMACRGGAIEDIVVGDLLLWQSKNPRNSNGRIQLAYTWLRDLGLFPADAPHTLFRISNRTGQLTPADLVDRYELQCRPIRDLLVAYLSHRSVGLDFTTLQALTISLALRFWGDLERHHPGIDSLRLPAEVMTAWKVRLATKTVRKRLPDGSFREFTEPRRGAIGIKTQVRAFYLDLAEWAVEDPGQWAAWVAPCPISEAECSGRKAEKQLKARMDQRTRERLPALPTLVKTAHRLLKEATMRLDALNAAPLGSEFSVLGETFRVPRFSKCADGRPVHAWDAKGTRRSFAGEERSAFWGWAAIEILRHTGIRIEELLELGHHSIVSYKLPTTGQTVPLLQIAPSKTDQERLVLVTPELADVLSTVVSRVRGSDGRVPVLRSYDHYERVWNPPMPLLFQDRSGGYLRPLSRATIRRGLDVTMLASGLTDSAGAPLIFQPHDFRRIFITDSILNGLPPHIAQVIAGHDHIGTTMGYAAIYPTDAIEAHRAFIARRRALRPADEYRTVTPEEWGEFLGHFERRKLALGDCGRAYGTDCAHEHACVRCPALIVHATERPRLVEIRDNLLTRILEAEREGWLGEIEGLQSSLTHAEEKLAQLDAQISRKQESVDLGIPTFREIVARTTAAATPPEPRD